MATWSQSRLIRGTATPLIYLVLLVGWELLVRLLKIPTWILPAPTAIFAAAVKWAPELAQNSWVTLRETILGFLLAVVLSLPLAALISLNSLARKLLYPILLGLQSVPKVAVAPLIILWLGLSEWPKIIVVMLVCFFPILVNMVAGIEAVPKTMLDLMNSMQASPRLIFFRLRVPVALPHFFTGCKVAVTFAGDRRCHQRVRCGAGWSGLSDPGVDGAVTDAACFCRHCAAHGAQHCGFSLHRVYRAARGRLDTVINKRDQ